MGPNNTSDLYVPENQMLMYFINVVCIKRSQTTQFEGKKVKENSEDKKKN
jgi:hypothetical protein